VGIVEVVDCSKAGLVRQIVAQESDRNISANLVDDSLDRATLVASDTQFNSGFKWKERQALDHGGRLEKLASSLLNQPGTLRRKATPVHDCCIRFVFEKAAKSLMPQHETQFIELAKRFRRSIFQFTAPIDVQPFSAMQAPDFNRRGKLEQSIDLACRTTGDHAQLGTVIFLNLGKEFSNAGPGTGSEAVDSKIGKRAIIVQQQYRRFSVP